MAMNDDIKALLQLLSGGMLKAMALDATVAQVMAMYENIDGEQDWLDGIGCRGGVPSLRLMYGIFLALSRQNCIATFGRWQDAHGKLCLRFGDLFPPVPAWVTFLHEYLSWAETACHRRGYELLEYPEGLTDDLHVVVVERALLPRLAELGDRFDIVFRPAFDSQLVPIRRAR